MGPNVTGTGNRSYMYTTEDDTNFSY